MLEHFHHRPGAERQTQETKRTVVRKDIAINIAEQWQGARVDYCAPTEAGGRITITIEPNPQKTVNCVIVFEPEEGSDMDAYITGFYKYAAHWHSKVDQIL